MKKGKTKNVILLLVEGDTESAFYKKVIDYIAKEKDCKFEQKIKNLKGIGNFQRSAVTQYNELRRQYQKKEKDTDWKFHVFLCIDTDVFAFHSNPPLDKEKLQAKLEQQECVADVHYIEARESIEDWFLEDLEGIQKYLKLKSISDSYKKGKNGADKLNLIFQKAGKVYIKGGRAKELIQHLNIPKIIDNHKNEFSALYNCAR